VALTVSCFHFTLHGHCILFNTRRKEILLPKISNRKRQKMKNTQIVCRIATMIGCLSGNELESIKVEEPSERTRDWASRCITAAAAAGHYPMVEPLALAAK
jgi:hypothetical protein